MKSPNEPLAGSPQSQTKKVKRRHSSGVDYYSELRDWVQHVILEAEKNKGFQKICETGHCSSRFELRCE